MSKTVITLIAGVLLGAAGSWLISTASEGESSPAAQVAIDLPDVSHRGFSLAGLFVTELSPVECCRSCSTPLVPHLRLQLLEPVGDDINS